MTKNKYAREKRIARKIRSLLLDLMGRKCKICKKKKGPWHLDHKYERTWALKKHSRLDRMKRYLKDWANDNLRVLCPFCNCSDGGKRRWRKHVRSNVR